jgi:hypothetical protein
MSCITAASRVLASARRPSGVIVDTIATAGAPSRSNTTAVASTVAEPE